jgi:DNA uptake protein ComE-like DNA-binding protein
MPLFRRLPGLFAVAVPMFAFAAAPAPQPPLAQARPTAAAPLDLNTATVAQLELLPGMGAAYAARIVKGRPYTSKLQLTQRGILPEAAYARIKDLIVAKHPR